MSLDLARRRHPSHAADGGVWPDDEVRAPGRTTALIAEAAEVSAAQHAGTEQSVPAGTAPVESALVESALVDSARVESTPVELLPPDTALVESAPFPGRIEPPGSGSAWAPEDLFDPADTGRPDLPDPAAGPVVSDGRLHRATVGGAGPDPLEPPAEDPAGPAWPAPSWAEIVEQHSARVFRLAYRLTGNRHDAEDLTQDVFVRVFRALPTFTPGNFDAWIHRITTNLFLDGARRRKRIRFDALDPEAGERLPDPAAGPDERYHLSNLDGDVRRALMALRPEFRAAVVLADIEGLPYDEVADALGIKLGTVRSRIHRGRAQLREQLAHRAPVPRPATAADGPMISVTGTGASSSTVAGRGPVPLGGTAGVAVGT